MKRSFIKYPLILIFVICACVLLAAMLFACDAATYTLTFIADKAVVDTLQLEAGSPVVAPEAPHKDGFEFDGWYDDPAFGEDAKLAPEEAPAHDATYYAKYVRVVGYKIEYYVQMLNEDRTAVSDRYTTTEVALREGRPGNTIALSDVEAHAPEGYIYAQNENEVLSLTLGEDESQNVLKVYYARRTYYVSFDANGGEGTMAERSYPYGATVSGDFENAFTREGWRFAGFEGSYDDGTPIPNTAFTIKGNATFKARWQISYQNAADANDIVYFDGTNYYRMTDDVRENAVLTSVMSEYGFDEFIFGEGTDAEKVCRLYMGEDKFVVGGDEAGAYLLFDYTLGDDENAYGAYVLSLDGFGTAALSQILMGGATQSERGTYTFNEGYDDWTFIYADAPEAGFYFDLRDTLPANMPEDAQFDGSFVIHGEESGEFVEFLVLDSEIADGEVLQLFGNGYARILGYDADSAEYDKFISEGRYYGTENYGDYLGEWYYSPTDESGTEGFGFVLNVIEGGEAPIYVYMRYDERLDVELHDASGNGGKLVLGGYNAAIYTVGGTSDEMSGAISFLAGSILRFTPYSESGTAEPSVDFDVDLQGGTFSLNTTGLEVENGVLKGYIGTSSIVAIPDGVTEIAADALSYRNTGVNLTSVTIPASVTKIGARAFENWYTLTSVVFEGEQPISGIDWSDANSPFRWPMAGAFRIFVPDDALEAYKAAWTDCPYKITSVYEQNNKPEFEVEDGVLISYNCKTEDPANLSIVLPDDVLRVADGVFAYITYIASVDLNNATEIGASAFEGCSGLVSVKADKLEKLGGAAFALCTSLESITLPAAKELGAQAFVACDVLEKVSLGAGIQRIGDRAFSECAYDKYPTPFVLEFADGSLIPLLGDNVFYGIESGYRVSVATFEDALALYNTNVVGWAKCAGRATVRANETSAIAGEWIDIVTLHAATVGGRLETADAAYIYALDGEALTLHYYSYSEVSGSVSRGTLSGTYKDGKISFADDGESYVLVRRTGKQTYATAEGETLVIDLDSYKVEEIPDSEGYAPITRTTVGATFAGHAGEIAINGNSLVMSGVKLDGVTIAGARYDGIKCDLSLTLSADGSFAYATSMNDARGPYTASDGSYISVEYYGDGRYLFSSVCMTGCLKQFRSQSGGDIVVETRGTWQVIELPSDGTYVFSYNYLNDLYYVTVTLDEPSMTFTYSAEKAASRVVLTGNNGGRVVALLDKDGKTILSLSLMLQGDDGSDTLYVRAFTLQADGSYLAEAEQREMVYDPATGTYVEQLGSLSGVYVLTLDFAKGTCTIVYQGELGAGQ